MKTYRLKDKYGNRPIKLDGRTIADSPEVSPDEQINPSQCIHCGADLPSDWDFQAFHMLRVHGLEV